jgi:nucleoside-diphosphate-sugar epimerase
MDTNLAMLRNLMDPLSQSATGLKHVSLLQGTKAYGVHLHPIRIPARERFPRDPHENFYWLQEDYVRAKSARDGWAFTIWRPQLIVGPNYGVVMNLPPIIGAFAAICREEGRPFGFPGGASWVWEAVDTRLVADALVWGATAANAKGETFNLTNGEVFEWRDLWPSFAEVLGVRPSPDHPVRLAEFLPAKADVWDRIVAKHGLRKVPMSELVGESHHYADFCFAYGTTSAPPPAFVSTVKIKQAGFVQVYDTEETFRYWLRKLIERKILPPANA